MDQSKDFLCSSFDNNFENIQENVKICEYLDLSNLTDYKPSSDTLFMSHINIRSIQKHIDILCELIFNMCRLPDNILLTETWIQEAPEVNLEMQGYNLLFANSPTKAGGVAMYFSKEINFEIATDYNLKIKGCKNMWATICTPQHKLWIEVMYQHPNFNLNSFLDNFNLTLGKINTNKCQNIIMGDFNVSLLNETPFVTNYKNIIAKNAFFLQ